MLSNDEVGRSCTSAVKFRELGLFVFDGTQVHHRKAHFQFVLVFVAAPKPLFAVHLVLVVGVFGAPFVFQTEIENRNPRWGWPQNRI